MRIAIIGQGAAGTFAAIRIKEELELKGKPWSITLYEKGAIGLRKVKISGGGRCNVTNRIMEPAQFAKNYPRGKRELIGPFHSFCSKDIRQWFSDKGVALKEESDGRVFPKSNSSQTIIDCFNKELNHPKITKEFRLEVKAIEYEDNFNLTLNSGDIRTYDFLILATGSDKSGYFLAQNLGHSLTDMAPSLFTFKCSHPFIKDLPGTSFSEVSIKMKIGKTSFEEKGPLLITHWGLSGPAILKLSAWGAREIKSESYRSKFNINFLNKPINAIESMLFEIQKNNAKKSFENAKPEGLTQNFWKQFAENARIELSLSKNLIGCTWEEVPKKDLLKVAQWLYNAPFTMEGHHRFKEEFVECGGVSTKEINFKTMESKIVSGLYFAGEILDIDGITGGFNFQNAWTGADLIAHAIASVP